MFKIIKFFSLCFVPQTSKMLKPDKWQAAFDGDGKILGFQRVLKSIILGVHALIASLYFYIFMFLVLL